MGLNVDLGAPAEAAPSVKVVVSPASDSLVGCIPNLNSFMIRSTIFASSLEEGAKSKFKLDEHKQNSVGTFTNFAQNDQSLMALHTYMMYLKFGFGRATQDAGARGGQWPGQRGSRFWPLAVASDAPF